MATNLLTFGPSGGICASASAGVGHKRPEPNRRRSFSPAAPSPSPSPSSSNSGCWSPLFEWPSEPDYIDSGSHKGGRREDKARARRGRPGSPRATSRPRRRSS
ncbi:hypothetical protein ACJRO7_016414 [Eucalyptus globulus]|uniref:Uncharacterized protein n=1 Tax=Eucalyptus globulus TaxID=34317 RepID=A0ABD3L7B0_EUCGL